MENNEEKPKRRMGRPPIVRGEAQEKYGLTLPPRLAEWGKEQREGLSGLVRDLLTDEKKARESGEDVYRVSLPADLAQWAGRQPGGMPGLLVELLTKEKKKRES